MRTHTSTLCAIGAVTITTLMANAGLPTHSWLTPVNGNWTDPARWDAGTVPNSSSEVLLGLSGAYTVSSGGNMQAAMLTLSNPDATLNIDTARTLDLFGNLDNDGIININPFNGGSPTQLDFESDATISGSGEIRLGGTSSRARLLSASGFSITQSAGHSIRGFGHVEAALVNDGLVSADVTGQILIFNFNDKVNNSTMQSVSGAVIDVSGIGIDQSGGGELVADGVGSEVRFTNASVLGGEVQSVNGGFSTIVNATFDGVSHEGIMNIPAARTLDVFNSITNNGVITVNPGNGGSATQLDFESSGSFLGNGEVILDGTATRARLRTGTDVTMTNSVSHTIRGFGQIEADLINNGLVSADVNAQELFLNTLAKVNNDLMQAVDGGVLDFGGVGVSQAPSAQILADGPGSRIDFNSTAITGGQIHAINSARVDINSAAFSGVTISGPFNVLNSRSLDVFDSIVNNGTITINPGGGGSATQLDFENTGSFFGTGQVVLDSFATRSRLRTAVNQTMTNSATHTIRGFGQIEAALINNGIVSADVPNTEIFFNIYNKVNNGTMRAINTGELDIVGIAVDQTGGGEIIADGVGSNIDLNGATIIGGDITASNGASVNVFFTTGTLDGVNFSGDMFVNNAATLRINNSITNNGVITVNPGNGGSATQLDFESSGSFLGNGEVILDGTATRARLRTGTDVTMTNSANHTIRGFGQIEAALVNDGQVSADVNLQELIFISSDKVNNATMQAVDGGILDFSSVAVEQSGTAQIVADGAGSRIDLNNTTIVGGSIETMNGGVVEILNAVYDGVVSNADTNIQTARALDLLNNPINNNTIRVNPFNSGSVTTMRWLDDSELGGTGTIVLGGIFTRSRLQIGGDATVATLGSGQRLEGIGSIDAPLTHNGTTAPGLGLGTMLATQPITYTNSSIFEAEVNASTSDLLDSSSTIALNGILEVQFIEGFAPAGFWVRKIMEGSDIDQKFNSIVIPSPPAGFITRVYNDGSNLFVGQTCVSDTNLDGVLNFFDVSVFLSNYNAGNIDADLNGDAMLNFFDVSTFLSGYNSGC